MAYTVIDTTPYLTDEAKTYLKENQCTVRRCVLEELSEQQFCSKIVGVHGVLASGEWWTKTVLEAGASSELKIVARTGAGFDRVDIQSAAELGIWATNTPTATSHAVADFTIGLFLCLLRHIPKLVENVKHGKWDRIRGLEFRSMTLGVIGVGGIGREVIKRARGFGTRILGYDITPDENFAREYQVDYVSLEKLLSESDIVSLHCPLNDQTRNMIDRESLGLMKKNSYLVNTARPEVVDKPALVASLRTGKIAGAAIDVHDPMPCAPDDPLLSLENAIVTPWDAFSTKESIERMCITAAKDIVSVLGGGAPKHPVNKPQKRKDL